MMIPASFVVTRALRVKVSCAAVGESVAEPLTESSWVLDESRGGDGEGDDGMEEQVGGEIESRRRAGDEARGEKSGEREEKEDEGMCRRLSGV